MSGYGTDLKHVARSGVGRVQLRALSPEHVERIYTAVLASGCATGSVAHVRRTVSAALNAAARRGHRAQPGAAGGHAARCRRRARALRRPRDRRAAVGCPRRRNGARWSLAFLGLRQGEALALRWTDVDLDNAELRIRHALSCLRWERGCAPPTAEPVCGQRPACCPRRHGGGAHLGPPKSKAGRRTIAIPVPVVSELQEQRRRQAAERLAAGSLWHDQGFVITNHVGGPVDRRTDTDDWLDLVKQAGVRRLRLHDCRHSAATALLVLGANARVLMATMGWTSMALVQRYTHMVPELRHDVADRQTTLWRRAAAE
jgi:integrase